MTLSPDMVNRLSWQLELQLKASSSNDKNEEADTISRIEHLRETKRNIILRLPDVRGDGEMYDTMMNEVKEIEKEINENLIKLKGAEGTPQKSNRSPN